MTTILRPTPPTEVGNSSRTRAETLVALLADDTFGDDFSRWVTALAEVLAQGIVARDIPALEAVVSKLRGRPVGDVSTAVLEILGALLHHELRLDSSGAIEPGSLKAEILFELHPSDFVQNSDLLKTLGKDPTAVSRALNDLLSKGYVVRSSAGRSAKWRLSPKGAAVGRRSESRRILDSALAEGRWARMQSEHSLADFLDDLQPRLSQALHDTDSHVPSKMHLTVGIFGVSSDADERDDAFYKVDADGISALR
jgi:DNA-binding MarR family transcriptional regulator